MFRAKMSEQMLDLRAPLRRFQTQMGGDYLQPFPLAKNVDVDRPPRFTARLAQVDQSYLLRLASRQNGVPAMTFAFKQCGPCDRRQFHFPRQPMQQFKPM